MTKSKSDTSALLRLLLRAPVIQRWSLNDGKPENLAEHSYGTGVIALLLGIIRNKRFPDSTSVRPTLLATYGLLHDATEILTQDLVAPVKRATPQLHEAYKQLEHEAAEFMVNTLPDDLADEFKPLFTGSELTKEELKLVKAADVISAFFKAQEEVEQRNNREFTSALKSLEEKVNQSSQSLPEVTLFMSLFKPDFENSIDELFMLRD